MSQLVQKALDFLRPHRTLRLYPLYFVSESTRMDAKRVFEILSQDGEVELSQTDVEDVKKLVEDSCAKTDSRNIFNVINWDGFTILQRAVIGNQLSLVKFFIKKGCDVNAGICSFPLHIACKLGHVHVAQLLLTHGARADLECTVCSPEDHKLKTYPDQIFCLSYQRACTPILYALMGDHEQVLQLLLHHENSRQLVKTAFLLHEACKMGAHECLRYILQRYSEQMTLENTDGKTPLQISLLMDTDNAVFLMDNGAELKDNVFLTEDGTTLHELYRCKITLGLVKATKFALDHGFRSHINRRDVEGNTALYVLLRHVGRTVRSNIQSEYDMEVCDSIKLLLSYGANPNIANRTGESGLHAILSDSSMRQLYVSRHGQVRRLKSVLQEISRVVEILVAYGADAGQRSSPSFTSPLYYAIRIFQSLQPDMFVLVKAALKHLFSLLCQDSNVNATDSYGLTPFLLILHTTFKWISSSSKGNPALCKTLLPFVSELLTQFLKRGMNANAQLSYWTRRMDEAIESNYFKEIIIFLNIPVPDDPQFYDNIRHLLIRLVQREGNPNLLTFTPSYGTPYHMSSEIPKDASVSFLLTRAVYLQNAVTLASMLETLSFFARTLYQHKLSELVSSMHHFHSADFKALTLDPLVEERLDQLSNVPRSLRELTRIKIAQTLEWKLGKNCNKLPLPKPMIHYVVNFDM